MITESSKKHFNAISNEINDTCYRPSEVAHLLTTDHRYLQNVFAQTAIAFLFELGENYDKGYYDARNELMARVASEIVAVAKQGLHTRTDEYGFTHKYWDTDLSSEYYFYLKDKERREREND